MVASRFGFVRVLDVIPGLQLWRRLYEQDVTGS